MELHEALSQIGEIRAKLARTETVAPSRSLTVGMVGVLGCAAGLAQSIWIPQPMADLPSYLWLWISVAVFAVGIVATEWAVRYCRAESTLSRRAMVRAVDQFVPCLVAGGGLTWAIVQHAPESAALLPGLWAITFGLGMFAVSQQLPSATPFVAAHYLASGLAALVWARDANALSPWAMVVPFGMGHFFLAATFYFCLERRHGTN